MQHVLDSKRNQPKGEKKDDKWDAGPKKTKSFFDSVDDYLPACFSDPFPCHQCSQCAVKIDAVLGSVDISHFIPSPLCGGRLGWGDRVVFLTPTSILPHQGGGSCMQ